MTFIDLTNVSIFVDKSTDEWTKDFCNGKTMGVNIDRIKSLREKLGLTQEQAAEKAGLKNRQYWNNIETGQRANLTIDTLEKIAKALGVKPADLLK